MSSLPIFVHENYSSMAYAALHTDDTAQTETYDIVAVGDSITAGYEYGFTEQSVPYGFVEHLYEQALFNGLSARYTNYGVLGLRTAGLKRWIGAVVQGATVKSSDIQKNLPDPRADRIFAETKQLRAALGKADLIVMTIGGNDMYAVLAKLEEGAAQAEAAVVLDNALNIYETELEAALRLMLTLQPNAQIVVADQYMPIPPPVKIGALTFPLYPEADRLFLMDSLKQQRKRLDEIIARLTNDGFKVKAANVANAFTGNELRFTSVAEGDIHPSREGYAAMGKAFTKVIWGTYRTVTPRENGVPVSIVVMGKEILSNNKPVLVQNRVFVPLRDITDAMGATIKWHAASQTAAILLKGHTVDISVGASTIRTNGVPEQLNAQPAFLQQIGTSKKLYVPLAALSDGLHFQVAYRDTLKTVFINK
jgi:lysophospholipase L1-like esterase